MPVSIGCRDPVLMSNEEELEMVKTTEDVVNAAEVFAKKQAVIFLNKNPKASKQEIFQRAFLAGMATGVEMLTYKEKQK